MCYYCLFNIVHAMDIVKLPDRVQKKTNRAPAKKVPNWHITSD